MSKYWDDIFDSVMIHITKNEGSYDGRKTLKDYLEDGDKRGSLNSTVISGITTTENAQDLVNDVTKDNIDRANSPDAIDNILIDEDVLTSSQVTKLNRRKGQKRASLIQAERFAVEGREDLRERSLGQLQSSTDKALGLFGATKEEISDIRAGEKPSFAGSGL